MVFQHKYIENEVCFYVEQLRAKKKRQNNEQQTCSNQ